ncbi:MAG: divalent-cation tolerance protein CutA [Hyphomicrobiaceae bacterium]
MGEDDKPVLVYGTFPDRDTATSIAGELVDGKLAACVNVLGEMTSIYNWQGQRHADTEVAALIKTRLGLAAAVVDHVRARHPYDNPALVVIPVAGGSEIFLEWILAETVPPRAQQE